MKRLYITIFFSFIITGKISAQVDNTLYVKDAIAENRTKLYQNLVNNSITKNLSLSLSDSAEDNWQDAFMALELLNYKSAWIDGRISSVFNSVNERSLGFQRAFLELVYTNYPDAFIPQIVDFIKKTDNTKLFSMCAEYLFMNNRKAEYRDLIIKRMSAIISNFTDDSIDPFFTVLIDKLLLKKPGKPPIADLLHNSFLHNETILYSFQRKNRNYPGLAMIRGRDGKFIKDENGNYFSVPQLARSISNMPGYLTNGNTPQGIFKINGLGISKSNFIGPTANIQMLMPYERTADAGDSLVQSFGNHYASLLPTSWKNYFPVYESYYAGKTGRTEIIAHGTTVNPEYYINQPYYPQTPTQGCLCTKEIWSTEDGKRLESDQQKLVNAFKASGAVNGYCVVIEIDDLQKPVSLSDILSYLKSEN